MVVFILILILLAILFSTRRGRSLLEWVFFLPFRIIGYPLKLAIEKKKRLENKERILESEEKKKSEFKAKEKARRLFSEKQFRILDNAKFDESWEFSAQQMLWQVNFFESILEGGQDPRVLNLSENFDYIQEDILNKAKKNFLENNINYTPEIIQHIRKYVYASDVSLNYDEIRNKLGRVPIIGIKSKERIESVLKDCTDFDTLKINEITDYIVENIQKK